MPSINNNVLRRQFAKMLGCVNADLKETSICGIHNIDLIKTWGGIYSMNVSPCGICGRVLCIDEEPRGASPLKNSGHGNERAVIPCIESMENRLKKSTYTSIAINHYPFAHLPKGEKKEKLHLPVHTLQLHGIYQGFSCIWTSSMLNKLKLSYI